MIGLFRWFPQLYQYCLAEFDDIMQQFYHAIEESETDEGKSVLREKDLRNMHWLFFLHWTLLF